MGNHEQIWLPQKINVGNWVKLFVGLYINKQQ